MESLDEKLTKFKTTVTNNLNYYDEPTQKRMNTLADNIVEYLLGNSTKVPNWTKQNVGYEFWSISQITEVLKNPTEWDAIDLRIIDIVAANWGAGGYYCLERYLMSWLNNLCYYEKSVKEMNAPLVIDALLARKITFTQIFEQVKEHNYSGFYIYVSQSKKTFVSSLGRKLLEYFPKESNIFFAQTHYYINYLIELFAKEKPKETLTLIDTILPLSQINQKEVFEALINLDPKTVAPKVVAKIEHELSQNSGSNNIWYYLIDIGKVISPHVSNFNANMKDFALKTLENFKATAVGARYFYDYDAGYAMTWLMENFKDEAKPIIIDYLSNVPYTSNTTIFEDAKKIYSESDAIDIILAGMGGKVPSYNLKRTFSILAEFDITKNESTFWDLMEHKNKTLRTLTAPLLAKLGEKSVDKAAKLLDNKKADIRQSATFLLSLIGTKPALEHIKVALSKETNDDARDLMLEIVASKNRKRKYTEAEVKETIEDTDKRKKLDKFIREWLQEKDLPELHWKSGAKLTEKEVRFLMYRQSRAKGMRPDPEAKPMYGLIDKTKSGKFAKAVLSAYTKGKCDSKDKFCLSLAGFLGDDSVVDSLKATIMDWTSGSRGKMAEYAVQALAMVGTAKALRVVEFCSRKFASKQKNVGAAAKAAFVDAAEELDISMYELEDMIVPDFDFEGTHKTFKIKDKEFRAFIDSNFTLVFMDEDNKKYKTLPKAADKAIQDEFKTIAKEAKDVIKNQHQKMQNYMVAQRKWTSERWQELFMNNPLLYPYATSLIWGMYDEKNTLKTSFFFNYEAFLDTKGEEMTLDPKGFIGIIHPMELTEQERSHWQEVLGDYGVEAPFNQMFREVIVLDPKEKTRKMYKEIKGKIEMYAFRSAVEKNGWSRGSVQDGGSIASYYKPFSSVGVDVFMNIYGMSVDGYDYDDGVTVEAIYFVKHASVGTGSYSYDEPSDDKDKRLIAFGEVSPIIFSEVMAEIKNLESLVEKEENTENK